MVDGNVAYALKDAGKQEVEVVDSPVKFCTVTLSDVISRGKRLEASVFDVDAKQAWAVIHDNKFGLTPLYGDKGLIEKAYYPGWMQRSRLKRIWCEKGYGEGFFIPSQMNEIYPTAEKYISRLANCDMNELRLHKGTLLLTRSGTIGNVGYVSRTLDGLVFSDDVIRISFNQEYDLGYVYAFLKSKTGNILLRTNGYGSVITHIEPDHLEEIQIPNAPTELRKRIHDLIYRSYSLRDDSNDLIDEATSLLVKELQFPDIRNFDVALYKKDAGVDTFSVKLSDLSGRVDASYHVPIVGAIVDHMKQHAAEVTTVGDSRISKEIILPGRFKRVYVENGYGVPFFGGRSIGELDPSDKKYLSFSQHGNKIKNELTIHEGMILVTCSGTIGNVVLVPRHWDNWAMTHDIIRLKANDCIRGYLFIWLQSIYASELLKSYTYGSVVPHIEKQHLAVMPVPILKDKQVQKRINDLALEANEKRYEAYRMEQQALHIIDNEVINA